MRVPATVSIPATPRASPHLPPARNARFKVFIVSDAAMPILSVRQQLVAAGLGPPGEHALISLLALNGLRVSEATGTAIVPNPRRAGTRQERMRWYERSGQAGNGSGAGRRLAMGKALTIRVRRDRGYAFVAVAGEVDIATVTRLRESLFELAASDRALVVDLDQVTFIDSSGLAALVGAARRAAAHGASLQVVCARPRIRQLFHLTGLDGQVPLARTLDGALESLAAARPPPLPSGRAEGPARRPVPAAGMLYPPQSGIGRLCTQRPGGRVVAASAARPLRGRGQSRSFLCECLSADHLDQGGYAFRGRDRGRLAHEPGVSRLGQHAGRKAGAAGEDAGRLILVQLVGRHAGRVEQSGRAHDRPLQIAAADEVLHTAHVGIGRLADRRGDQRLKHSVEQESAVGVADVARWRWSSPRPGA